MSDQGKPDRKGFFLGWSMSLWGSAIDAAAAKPWVLPKPASKGHGHGHTDVPEEGSVTITTSSSATTKQHSKPTDHLPEDHGHAEGEAHKPGFEDHPPLHTTTSSTTSRPSSSGVPPVDEGYFSGMTGLLKSQTWVFVALGAVAVFGLSTGLFFLRRRQQQRARAAYNPVAEDEDIHMRSVQDSTGGQRGRTRELYDAFGEVSDDDEDADENMRLTGARQATPLGFHDGFLDDDDPNSARSPRPGPYRDSPLNESRTHVPTDRSPADGTQSPASGSGDGSWELASDAPRG